MKKSLALVIAAVLVAGIGCTMRSSRTLENVAASSTGKRVSKESTGLQVFMIEVNDTATAESLLTELAAKNNCRAMKNVEVDLRSQVFFGSFPIVGIPKLTVSASCE